MCPSTVEICITGPLSDSFVIGKEVMSKRVSLIDMPILRVLLNTLPTDEKDPVRQAICETCPNTVEICITLSLPYSLTTAKPIELEKVSLIETQNLGTAF